MNNALFRSHPSLSCLCDVPQYLRRSTLCIHVKLVYFFELQCGKYRSRDQCPAKTYALRPIADRTPVRIRTNATITGGTITLRIILIGNSLMLEFVIFCTSFIKTTDIIGANIKSM